MLCRVLFVLEAPTIACNSPRLQHKQDTAKHGSAVINKLNKRK